VFRPDEDRLQEYRIPASSRIAISAGSDQRGALSGGPRGTGGVGVGEMGEEEGDEEEESGEGLEDE